MDRHFEPFLRDPDCPTYVVGVEPVNETIDLSAFRDAIANTVVPGVPDAQVTLVGSFKFYPAAHPGHMLYVLEFQPVSPVAPKGGR